MAGNSLILVLRMLMLIPFLGAMGYGILMTKYGHEMQSGQPGFASEIVLKVGLAWLDHKVKKADTAVLDASSLNDERRVVLNRTVPLTDLPGNGDAALDTSRAEIAALAMAKQWGEAECAAMIGGFATRCGFSNADVRISDSGHARLTVALSFVTATPVGDTEGQPDAGLVPQRVALTDRAGMNLPAAAIPDERARLYVAAEAACAILRADKGSCVISEITFAEEPTEAGDIRLSASAEIAYLGQRSSTGGLIDLTTRPEPDAGMLAFAMKTMMEAQRAMTSGDAAEDGAPPELPVDAKTLLDEAKLPRFEKSQGGAKFVSPP